MRGEEGREGSTSSCILIRLEQSECISEGVCLVWLESSLPLRDAERGRERKSGEEILTVYCVTLHHYPPLMSAQLGVYKGATLIHH